MIALLLALVVSPTQGAAEPPRVLTSFYPTTWLVERLAGDTVRLECPLPPDADPAAWEPSREVLRRYQVADLVVLNGAGLEPWPEWASLPPSRVVVSALPFRDRWLRYDDGVVHSHGPEGEHSHAGYDGHTWLDPLLATEQAREIHRALARLVPEEREALDASLEELEADLAELHETFEGLAGPPQGEVVLASHPAYRYLERRYGWPVVSLDLDPEVPPDADQLARAREELSGRRARFLWWESEPSPEVAARVRAELGVESVVVSPIESPPGGARDFLDVQRRNALVVARTFAPEDDVDDEDGGWGMSRRRHAVLVHPALNFSGGTERLFATARALEGQGVRVTVVSSPGSRTQALTDEGFEPLFAELPPVPGQAPFQVSRTARLLRSLKPTVLHFTDESLCSLAARLSTRLDLPYVVEVHHPVEHRLEQSPGHLRGVVATSESLVEGIVNHGRLPRERIRVVRHSPRPLPLEGPGPFEREGLPRVGTAGFLDQGHDTEWFLEAARTLTRSDARYAFVIFGEGPRENALRRAIRQANLAEHVTLGVPTTGDVRRSVAALDVFVSCRLSGGPSWISCQALAQGVPSIFAASGEAFHLVRDRISGVLTEPRNGRRLAEEIQLMVENPEFARNMGLKGRERLLEGAPPERFERSVAETFAIAEGLAVVR